MHREIDHDLLVDMVARSRIAIFVGRNDTGKSTLIKHMADSMDVSLVDADIGQSDVGPPTVVALGERRGDDYEMTDGYFCGSTTPARHFLPLLAGASRMCGQVRRYPVLVNTTGLATGEIGRILKTEKINALRPDLIIGLGGGLAYLDAFAKAGATVVHLPVGPNVKPKSPSVRAALRQRSFNEHFKKAKTITYPFKKFRVERSLLFNGDSTELIPGVIHLDVSDAEALVIVRGRLSDPNVILDRLDVDVLHVYAPEDFVNVLVGLVDRRGKFLGLGIIEEMEFGREEIALYSSAVDPDVLQFGSIKINRGNFRYAGAFSGSKFMRKHK